ncbi:unnamed protein product [Heligmosomoides polygyrus]|uniref:COesterase domain-containing protein n=1 Tax=Heligmosomoides polygyrus TaxID=6339 RepID=A0A183FG39_HELPZ|nr:unnamed protein product [Heligmosomoides polygyrus]
MSALPATVILLLCCILLQIGAHPPKLELGDSPVLFGTIHGSPVMAMYHGNSDVLKDDVQNKDTEDDPLDKMGPVLD